MSVVESSSGSAASADAPEQRNVGRLEANEKPYVRTVKFGLNSFVNGGNIPGMKEKIIARIREDVCLVSALMMDTSYFMLNYYKHYYEHKYKVCRDATIFDGKISSAKFAGHFQTIHSPKKHIADPLHFIPGYLQQHHAREAFDPRTEEKIFLPKKYDSRCRARLIAEACAQYDRNFETNIKTHMLRRIKCFVRLCGFDEDKERRDLICTQFYNEDPACPMQDDIAKLLKIHKLRSTLVEKQPLKYVPFLFYLQEMQTHFNVKRLAVFPICRQPTMHVRYVSKGMRDILAAVGAPVKSELKANADVLHRYWHQYFNIPTGTATKSFGWSFTTDGVVANISMDHIVPKIETPRKRAPKRKVSGVQVPEVVKSAPPP